jgi:putative sugar O-methyltransferase
MKDRILEMNNILVKGPIEVQPSKYWLELNKIDQKELEKFGFENFKRNIVRHYFTPITKHPLDMQIKFLLKNVNPIKVCWYFLLAISRPKHKLLGFVESINYNFRTLLIWEYAKNNDRKNYLALLNEPLFGNPPRIYYQGRLISNDLANTLLEFYATEDYVKKDKKYLICEIGPGYGRNAFVHLTLQNNVQYILVDIPPALFVAEKYLTEVFPGKKIFKFRDFNSFSQIKEEFENSDICFLLSSQLQSLPESYIDMFVNISSFHEMRMAQIKYYFREMERILKKGGLLYMKEWIKSQIPFENVTISYKDYPFHELWKKIFFRRAKIQTEFFEALYKLEKS